MSKITRKQFNFKPNQEFQIKRLIRYNDIVKNNLYSLHIFLTGSRAQTNVVLFSSSNTFFFQMH